MSSTATIAITIPEAACSAQFSRRGEVFQNSAAIPPAKLPAPGSSDSRRTYQSTRTSPLGNSQERVPSGTTSCPSMLRDDGAVVVVLACRSWKFAFGRRLPVPAPIAEQVLEIGFEPFHFARISPLDLHLPPPLTRG